MIWNQFNMNVSPQSAAFNKFFFCITGDNFTSERTCPRWRKPWSVLIPIQLTSVLFRPHHPEVKQLHTPAGLVIHHILLWLMSFFTSLSALINTENWLILSKDFLSCTSCTSMHTCEVFLPGRFFKKNKRFQIHACLLDVLRHDRKLTRTVEPTDGQQIPLCSRWLWDLLVLGCAPT